MCACTAGDVNRLGTRTHKVLRNNVIDVGELGETSKGELQKRFTPRCVRVSKGIITCTVAASYYFLWETGRSKYILHLGVIKASALGG